jgi:hypothetical protein
MGTTGLRADDKKDWRDAGVAIVKAKGASAVVAEQMARFVSGGPVDRLKVIENLIRNGYNGRSIGRRFEFPDALKRLQKSYDIVTAPSLSAEMNRLASTDRAAAVEKCKGLLKIADVLDPQIRNSDAFENSAIQMEMLKRLVDSRNVLAEAIQGFSGQSKPENDPALLQQAARRLQDQLTSFAVAQAKVGEELHKLLEGDKTFVSRRLGEAKGLIRQLDDIHKRWRVDYNAMKQTQSKLGNPSWDTPPAFNPVTRTPLFQPSDEMLARFEKAAGLR